MKRLLSLFDYSGTWSQPYYQAGWDVIHWDIKLGRDIQIFDSVEKALSLIIIQNISIFSNFKNYTPRV